MSPAGSKELLYSTREEQVNLLAQVRVSQHNRLSLIWILISILAIAMPATMAAFQHLMQAGGWPRLYESDGATV